MIPAEGKVNLRPPGQAKFRRLESLTLRVLHSVACEAICCPCHASAQLFAPFAPDDSLVPGAPVASARFGLNSGGLRLETVARNIECHASRARRYQRSEEQIPESRYPKVRARKFL